MDKKIIVVCSACGAKFEMYVDNDHYMSADCPNCGTRKTI